MPVYPKPDVLPAWTKPENASVLDPWYRAPLRTMVSLLGLDDPQQIMALGVPLETGAMTGGAVDALAAKFPRVAQVIKAYHGSPHDFDAFDASHIGTGEGNQAYGHGLYFAEKPEVAQTYKGVQGAASSNPAANVASKVIAAGRDPVQRLKSVFPGFSDEQIASAIATAKAPPAGKMYEVAINGHPDQFLDWDVPLSEQPESVRKAIAPLQESYRRTEGEGPYIPAHATGRQVVNEIAAQSGGQAQAAQALNDLGIPGIKYLDGASRRAGAGSRNYVVFDPATVEILKKYGIVLPAVGLGAAEAAQQNK